MFPVETLPAAYYEERAAADAARKLAEERTKAAGAAQNKAPIATQQASPSSLAQSLQPSLTRAGSSGVLGSIFQGLARRGASPSPAPSMAPSRTSTPVSQTSADRVKPDVEAMKRDTDICALPGWH